VVWESINPALGCGSRPSGDPDLLARRREDRVGDVSVFPRAN
jgi:hypothetical protein